MLKNIKRILVCFVLAFSLVMFACSEKLSSDNLDSKIESLLKEQKAESAILLLKNYLVDNQKDVKARELLGRALAIEGKYIESAAQFSKIAKQVKHPKSIEALFETDYFLANNEDLINAYHTYSKTDNTLTPTTLLTHALVQIRTKQNDEYLEQLSKQSGEDCIFEKEFCEFIAAIDTFYSTRDKSEFNNNLDRISIEYPKLLENWLFLAVTANSHYNQTNFDKSFTFFESLLSLRPYSHEVRLFVADSLVKNNKEEEALVYINQLLTLFPNQPLANQLKAYVLVDQNQLEPAKTFIERAIQNGLDTNSNLVLAGLINYDLENYEQTISFLERAIQKDPSLSRYNNILLFSKAAVNSSDLSVSPIEEPRQIEEIKSVLTGYKTSGNVAAVFNLASQLDVTKIDDPVQKLDALILKSAFTNETNESQIITLSETIIANANAIKNNFNDVDKAKLVLITTLVNGKRYSEALSKTHEWMLENPTNLLNKLLHADTLFVNEKFSDALDIWVPIQAQLNDETIQKKITMSYGRLAEFDKAKASSLESLRMNKYDINVLRRYQTLRQTFSDPLNEEVLNLYSSHETNLSDTLMLSTLYAMEKDYEQAFDILEKYVGSTPLNASYWYSYGSLAKLTNQTALIREAAVKLSLIGKIKLESIKDILIFMKQNDFGDLLVETLSKQIKVYPTNTYLIYTLVEELAQRGQLDEALSALELVEDQSSVDVIVTRGTITQQQGKLKQAQQNFEDAYSAFPSSYTLKKLISFYSLINANESALKVLNTHIESFPTDNQAKLMLAFRSNSSDAIRLYREVLIDSPDNSVALNNLAWELHSQGKNKEAIEFSDKAVKISPEQESFKSTNEIIRGALLEN